MGVRAQSADEVFGTKREEVKRDWRKVHTEALRDLCSSSNIIWVMKSSSWKWSGYVTRVGEKIHAYRV